MQKVEYLLNRNSHTSHKYAHAHFITSARIVCEWAHFIASTRVYNYCVPNCAQIFSKIFLVVNYYLMSLSLKYHKAPSFCWEDIPLFATVHNLEHKTLGFFHPKLWSKVKQLFWHFGTPSGLFFMILSINNLNLKRIKKLAILMNIKVRRELWLTMNKHISSIAV